jgi:hypothetical protein
MQGFATASRVAVGSLVSFAHCSPKEVPSKVRRGNGSRFSGSFARTKVCFCVGGEQIRSDARVPLLGNPFLFLSDPMRADPVRPPDHLSNLVPREDRESPRSLPTDCRSTTEHRGPSLSRSLPGRNLFRPRASISAESARPR